MQEGIKIKDLPAGVTQACTHAHTHTGCKSLFNYM